MIQRTEQDRRAWVQVMENHYAECDRRVAERRASLSAQQADWTRRYLAAC